MGEHYYGSEKPCKPELFDQLKEGTTLREIVALLGPGAQNRDEGVGFINWRCKNRRILQVFPTRQLDEKARYRLWLSGTEERHEDVGRLVKALISKIDIDGEKVAVTWKVDTHQAKGGQPKRYRVGQPFQRIDFTPMKIEDGAAGYRYFYQAPPEGLLHYSESGTLMLRPGKSPYASEGDYRWRL